MKQCIMRFFFSSFWRRYKVVWKQYRGGDILSDSFLPCVPVLLILDALIQKETSSKILRKNRSKTRGKTTTVNGL